MLDLSSKIRIWWFFHRSINFLSSLRNPKFIDWILNEPLKLFSTGSIYWISRSATRRKKNTLPEWMSRRSYWNLIFCNWNQPTAYVQSKSDDVSSPSSSSFDEFRKRIGLWQGTWKGELRVILIDSYNWACDKPEIFQTKLFFFASPTVKLKLSL